MAAPGANDRQRGQRVVRADDMVGRNGCRGISAPAGSGRNVLTLHQKGIGIEYRAVAHRYAVMDEGTDPEGAVVTDHRAAGLERAVLLRVALNLAARIQHGMVSDRDQSPLRQITAIVEDPASEPDTQQAPDQILERGAVEDLKIRVGRHLPEAFVPPEVRVVIRTQTRLQPPECREAPLDQDIISRAEHDAEGEERADHGMVQHIVEIGRGHAEQGDQEKVQPPNEQENTHGSEVVPLLRGQAAAQFLAGPEVIELAVTLDRPRDLEGR